jgi:hypothetical protein
MSNPLGEVTRSPALKDGLDDGPELPSQAARDRAYARIDAQRLITDEERLNFMERIKYLQLGIGYNGFNYAVEVRFNNGGLKRFFGRSLRGAVDEAIKAEGK